MLLPSHIIESIVQIPRGYNGKNDHQFRENLFNSLSQYGSPERDDIGNIWLKLGEPNNLLFVAHTDTVDSAHTTSKKPITVDSNGIMMLDEKKYKRQAKAQRSYCLGADDGAGIATLYCLIEAGISGTYLFTVGEEKGCVGASYIAESTPEKLEPFTVCIEVDRAGTHEIITEQSTGLCASDDFATALAEQIGMGHEPSPHGVYTDNAHFNEHIEECVNIAAGYNHQHTLNETQDLQYLDLLFVALTKVDFSQLPVKRDKTDMFNSLYDDDWLTDDHWYGKRVRTMTKKQRCIRFIEENPEEIYEMLIDYGISIEDSI